MDISKSIVEYVSRVLKNQPNRTMHINSIANHISNLKPKQKKYIKKTGWKHFITSHPNEFALVDDNVYLLQEPAIPRPMRQTQSSGGKKAVSSSSSGDNFTPPSKATITKIKQDIIESNLCVVCSDPMEVYAIGACFHPICFKCSTKLRVLCKDYNCPWCRMSLTKVYYTKNLAPEAELNIASFIKEQKYGVLFENQQIRNMHRVLLEHRCPKANCAIKYDDFDDLRAHMQKKHGEYFCDLCVQQCKIFTHERETYSSMELREHEGDGDANSASANKGHPLCPFCMHRYLDRDELLRHLQQHHCSCHLCFEQSHVFYRDIDELWAEHHTKFHFACSERECHGLMKTVFKTEEELKAHIKERHSWHRPSAGKRAEQHVTLDVTFGSQRAGLQFGAEQSSGFRLTSVRGTSILAEGHLTCTGVVINVSFFWGFIERDGCRGEFQENIFFDKRSCQLNNDDDLKSLFKLGDRVEVLAVKSDQSHRSKWRAIDVTKIDESEIDRYSTRTRTYSDSSFMTSDDLDSTEAFTLEGSFPALPNSNSDLGFGTPSSANSSNWSTVVKTKKAVKPVTNVPPKVLSSPKKMTKKKEVPLNGDGYVYHLEAVFGFISRANNAFEDNIYFNLQAYRDGTSNPGITDLTKELKQGEKISYTLEEPGLVKRNTKSKYRAISVWKFAAKAKGESNQSSQPSSSTSKVTSGLNADKVSNTAAVKAKIAPAPVAAPVGKKKKSKNKENIAPPTSKKKTKPESNQTNKKEAIDLQPSPRLNGLMDLDTFETTNNLAVRRSLSSDIEEIFRNLLVDITGVGDDDVLFEFDQELAINEVKLSQIAFIRFSEGESPKIHSVLLPSSNGHSVGLRHRQFSLHGITGFNNKAIKTLSDKGTILINDDTLYYVNKSNFYITLRKDECGTPIQLFLHTPFNTIFASS